MTKLPSGRGAEPSASLRGGEIQRHGGEVTSNPPLSTAAYAGVGAGQRGEPAIIPTTGADKAAPSRAHTARKVT